MESTGRTEITPIQVPIDPRMRVPVHGFEDRTPFASVQFDGDVDLPRGVRVEKLHRRSLFARTARVFAVRPVSGQLTIPCVSLTEVKLLCWRENEPRHVLHARDALARGVDLVAAANVEMDERVVGALAIEMAASGDPLLLAL